MGISVDNMHNKLKHIQSATDIANLLSTACTACLYATDQACLMDGSHTWQVCFNALKKLCDKAEAKLMAALPDSTNTPHTQPLPGNSRAAHHASMHMEDHCINTWCMMHEHDTCVGHLINICTSMMHTMQQPPHLRYASCWCILMLCPVCASCLCIIHQVSMWWSSMCMLAWCAASESPGRGCACSVVALSGRAALSLA